MLCRHLVREGSSPAVPGAVGHDLHRAAEKTQQVLRHFAVHLQVLVLEGAKLVLVQVPRITCAP